MEFEQRVTYLAHSTPETLWEDVRAVYEPVTAAGLAVAGEAAEW